MIPAPFEYAAPESLTEVLDLLDKHGDDAKVMAGGQSLLPVLRMRLNAPGLVIDLGRIEGLDAIAESDDAIEIGAMAPYFAVLAHDGIKQHASVLHKAVGEVADPQVRHRGTLGGALAHADPAGDCGAPALALDAEFTVVGPGRTVRHIPAADFFAGLFETSMAENEVLTKIRISKHVGWKGHYEKFVRVSQQWPIVAVAATVRMDGNTIAEARIGLTNMGSTPLRARTVEDALVGLSATEEAIVDACAGAGEGTNPPSDVNGDADYRRHLAGVLTRRAVLAAAQS